jgi:bifunctional UDP-N-acetylglucosamine pyrophosphorylase/glucosamine-1-phosphate N-acetyltransferase
MSLEIIILAAGQGTRMRSSIPKVLHKVADKALLEHVCVLAGSLSPTKTSVIYGHGGEKVLEALKNLDVVWVEQRERLGTGHAVMQLAEDIDDTATVLILYGDVPLLGKTSVNKLLELVSDHSLALLTVFLDDPFGYGRIERDSDGRVLRIVEEKDANAEQRKIKEGNTGILSVHGKRLKGWLKRISNQNAQGEYYLTDIIELAVQDGVKINTTQASCEDEVLGVNNRQQLAHLERVYQRNMAKRLMDEGVTIRDPSRIDIRGDIILSGSDIEIDVNVIFEGKVEIGERVQIGANSIIRNASLHDDCVILPNTVIEDAVVGKGSRVGPFARLRPGTKLGESVHIGNFVEIKKASVSHRSKVNHLSYIGDAKIGVGVNIGAGTITCNYDGVNKFETIIEDGAFIGSDTQLIAPVRVGVNATVGAGSTITKNAPDHMLTLSRTKQVTVESWSRPVKKKEG